MIFILFDKKLIIKLFFTIFPVLHVDVIGKDCKVFEPEVIILESPIRLLSVMSDKISLVTCDTGA